MTDLERLKAYDDELSKVMPPDFKDWWQNSKDEWPEIAAAVITNLRQREEMAWEQVEFAYRQLEDKS
jgi:cephalosporin-C deacetylase-like acetyl esterase